MQERHVIDRKAVERRRHVKQGSDMFSGISLRLALPRTQYFSFFRLHMAIFFLIFFFFFRNLTFNNKCTFGLC